jgi:uncharacterized integral membrane protein (TIGR00698 family)
MKIYTYGIALAVFIAFCSIILSQYIQIGTATFAILLGILVANIIKIPEKYEKGITFSEKTILGFAIALMGINLDFTVLATLGIKTIVLIVFSMIITIYSSILLGKYLKIDTKLALLLGIGNGVCGSSAISATYKIIKSNKEFVGISIAVVNLLGTIGIFLLPFVAFLFGLDNIDSGILIGNTLQAVGQVTAAGFSVSEASGLSATTVKMGRILMLTPLIFILIYLFAKNNDDKDEKTKTNIPLFIIFFILFSIVGSTEFLDIKYKEIISDTAYYTSLVALSAIGLKINFASIKDNAITALKLSSIVFFIQILITLIVIKFV